jgi:hypothetical protein
MVAVPVNIPVTTPVGEIEAIAPLLLLHTPPATLLVIVAEAPIHTFDGPLTGPGARFTVTSLVVLQPAMVYVTVVVPRLTEVTRPVVLPILATPVLLLVQVPPGT